MTLGRLILDTASGARPSGPVTEQERREIYAAMAKWPTTPRTLRAEVNYPEGGRDYAED